MNGARRDAVWYTLVRGVALAVVQGDAADAAELVCEGRAIWPDLWLSARLDAGLTCTVAMSASDEGAGWL